MPRQHIAKPPREQFFYRFLATVMTISNLGDQRWWGMGRPKTCSFIIEFHRKLIIYLPPIVLVSEIIFLYINFGKLRFDLKGIIFTMIPLTALVWVLSMSGITKNYEKIMKDFMDKIHIFNYKDESDFAYKKVMFVDRQIRWTAYALFTLLMCDWIGWIVTGFVQNLADAELIRNKTSTLQTIIYLYVPFDFQYNYKNWFIMHLLNVYFLWIGCLIIATFQSIQYMFAYNLLGHIDILRHKIKTNFDDADTDTEAKEKLIDIFKYHHFICRTFEDVQNAYGFSVSSYYLYNLIGDSLLLFMIMFGDARNRMLYSLMVTVYMGGLVTMSFVLEEFRRKTLDLSDLMYNLPWEKMSAQNQKILMTILTRMQPPLVFIASGGMIAGVNPMVSILKSTFSYYVMLTANMNG